MVSARAMAWEALPRQIAVRVAKGTTGRRLRNSATSLIIGRHRRMQAADSMGGRRRIAIRRPTVLRTAGRATGRHKETRRTADARHRDSALIVRAEQAQAKVALRRMRTGRRGRVLEIAGLLRAGIHDRTRPLTTAIGRPLHRQTAAAATRMAATRRGTGRISRRHVRVGRREVTTRILPLITPVVVAAVAPMRHHRVLIRHRAAVTLRRRRDPTRRLLLALIRRLIVVIPHPRRPRRHGPTPLPAAVMVVADLIVAAVEVPRAEEVAEVIHEAAADRTDTKNI